MSITREEVQEWTQDILDLILRLETLEDAAARLDEVVAYIDVSHGATEARVLGSLPTRALNALNELSSILREVEGS